MAIFKADSATAQRNLYIAYYARVPKPRSPGRYHAALVVLPATPKGSHESKFSFGRLVSSLIPSSGTPLKIEATKFHVVNVPVSDDLGNGRVSWEFRLEKDDISVKGTKLRMRLVALMLVGPVAEEDGLGADETVERAVAKVDIPKYTDLKPEWKCTSFIYEALNILETSNIIPALPTTPLPEFWNIGVQFADKWRTEESVQMLASGAAIPCCDREGNEILHGPLGPTCS